MTSLLQSRKVARLTHGHGKVELRWGGASQRSAYRNQHHCLRQTAPPHYASCPSSVPTTAALTSIMTPAANFTSSAQVLAVGHMVKILIIKYINYFNAFSPQVRQPRLPRSHTHFSHAGEDELRSSARRSVGAMLQRGRVVRTSSRAHPSFSLALNLSTGG